MSLYDDASLILYPSGYKEDKIYSLKPTDGSGDLTFTRASTATRVNAEGLIEGVRTNLFSYSEEFDNAYWYKPNATVTANATTSPDGTTNADKLVETVASGEHATARVGGMASAGTYSLSFYAKASERTRVAIGNSSAGHYAIFDLSLGTVVQASQGTVTNGAISLIGANGFYRVSCTITVASAASAVLNLVSTGTTISYTGDGTSGVFIWGAQLELSPSATEYIPTTTAAVSVGMLADVPRIDYTGGGCGKLLLESQRTNYAPKSEQLTSWGTYGVGTITEVSNAAISPDGTQNADEFTCTRTTSANAIFKYEITSTLPSGSMANSLWLKAKTSGDVGKKVCIWSFQGGNQGVYEATLTADWVRHSVTWTATAATTEVEFGLLNGYATSTLSVSFYAWGYQAEAGSYVSSYIPTTSGTAVTRLADAAFKTGISSLIGQTEGVIYWELDIKIPTATGLEAIVNIDNGSFGNTFYIYHSPAALIIAEMYVSSSNQATFTKSSITAGVYKCALGYANNNTAFFVNGVQVGSTDTLCSVPSTSRIQMGQTAISSDTSLTKQLILFPTRLTNTQLATLTTI